jgi:hypothetical protein
MHNAMLEHLFTSSASAAFCTALEVQASDVYTRIDLHSLIVSSDKKMTGMVLPLNY